MPLSKLLKVGIDENTYLNFSEEYLTGFFQSCKSFEYTTEHSLFIYLAMSINALICKTDATNDYAKYATNDYAKYANVLQLHVYTHTHSDTHA